MLYKLLAEAIGVFALCFVGGGAIYVDAMLESGPGLLGIALAHGLVLGVMITATMHVSGGHINPAVTIAMLLTGRISILHAVAYVAAQCAGGIVAGMLLWSVVFADIETPDGSFVVDAAQPTPAYDVRMLGVTDETDLSAAQSSFRSYDPNRAGVRAAVIEGVLTFFLVFTVFGTIVDPRAPKLGGLCVGAVVTADILIGGPLTGAAMNPARMVGTGLFPAIMTANSAFWGQLWVYWVGPVVGGVLAALLYQHMILKKQE